MKINNLMMIIIGATLGFIMIGSFLVPFVANYTDSTKEYYNNQYGPYADVSEDDIINLEITTTIGTAGSTVYSVNGTEVTVTQGPRAIVLSEKLTIIQNYNNGIGIYGVDSSNNLINTTGDSLTVTIDGNTISIQWALSSDNTSGEIITNSSWIFYRANVGNYRIIDYISSARTVYINELDQVYSSNWIGTTREFFTLNGTSVNVYSGEIGGTATVESTTASVTLTDVMTDVKNFVVDPTRENSGAFKFTVDNSGTPYDVYPYYFIVPDKVFGISDENKVINSMFTILPIVVMGGAVATVAYYVIGRK